MKLKKLLSPTIVFLLLLTSWACRESITESSLESFSRGVICIPTAGITAPFIFSGRGEYCWETKSLGTYIYSRNLKALEVNGTTYKNTWVASSGIPPVNNKYVIHYKSKVAWGYFIIGGCPSIEPTPEPTPEATPTSATTSMSTPIRTCIPCRVVISGTVTDSNGQPLAEVSVELMPNQKTVTDSLGYYSFPAVALSSVGGANCDPPYVILKVTAAGYQDQSGAMFLRSCVNYIRNFTLEAVTRAIALKE